MKLTEYENSVTNEPYSYNFELSDPQIYILEKRNVSPKDGHLETFLGFNEFGERKPPLITMTIRFSSLDLAFEFVSNMNIKLQAFFNALIKAQRYQERKAKREAGRE